MGVSTPEWVKDAVFYQIFPDRFAQSARVPKAGHLQRWGDPPHPHKYQGGDLLGVVEHLDHLVDLGVSAIYFCPVFQSASNHRYHTHDYYRVDPMLGGNEALRVLVDEAHARGLKVVLDGVFNHSSRGFFQFNDILENGEHSAYLDWFHVHGFPLHPYAGPEIPSGYEAWWGNRALPKFNTRTQAVREFLWGVAEHWIRFGIDGWRLDVPNEIDDDEFWQEFRRRVKNINPEAYIVGEIWENASRWLAGDQFDAVMNYLFTRPVLGFFGARTLNEGVISGTGYGQVPALGAEAFARQVTEILTLYPHEITLAQLNLLGSHDTPRFRTAAGGDESAFRLATLFQMTYPGAPCIYYGDEVGMQGGRDPDCRRAFPWHDPSSWNVDTLEYTRKLARVRRNRRVLSRGSFEVLHARGDLLAYARSLEGERAVVLINAGLEAASFAVAGLEPGRYREVLSGAPLELRAGEALPVAARTGLLLLRE